MPQKRMECFRLLFDHLACIEHQFLSGIRDSMKAGSQWGMMRGVLWVRKSIHHSWLAKGLGLGLICWGFKGVQEEIPREEASTPQIGSVAFPPGQYTSPQLHPCHRLFDQDGHQDTSSLSRQSRRWLFPKLRGCRYETIEEMKDAVTKVIGTLTQGTSIGPSRSCWNGRTSALQPEEITSKGEYSFMSVLSIKCPYDKSLETYHMHLVYIWYTLLLPRIYIYIYIYICIYIYIYTS